MNVSMRKFAQMIDAVASLMTSRDQGLDERPLEIRVIEAKRDVYKVCNPELKLTHDLHDYEVQLILDIVTEEK